MANGRPYAVTFEEMNEIVGRYMDHPFLDKHHVKQSISRFHFDATHAILSTGQVSHHEVRQVLSAVLLLHQGLSIHDAVDAETGLKRQLTVLAGDYDSSLYYWVLARLGNRPLLISLCKAVVSINEAKMRLCTPSPEAISEETYWKLHETIEGALILAVAGHYFEGNDEWLSALQSFIRAYVVHQQVMSDCVPKQVPLRQAMARMTEAIDRLVRVSTNHIVEPIGSFMMDYVQPLQNSVKRLAWAEGTR